MSHVLDIVVIAGVYEILFTSDAASARVSSTEITFLGAINYLVFILTYELHFIPEHFSWKHVIL